MYVYFHHHRRDRTLNFFSIMWNQRKKNEEEVLDLDELKKKKKSKKEKKTKKDFVSKFFH